MNIVPLNSSNPEGDAMKQSGSLEMYFDKDDNFVRLVDKSDPQYVNFPKCLSWMPCSSWKWDTWCGLAAIFSGMLCQAGMGVVSIWGNIVIYVVSKYHETEPELRTQIALIVFPLTYFVGALAMQLGSFMMDRI